MFFGNCHLIRWRRQLTVFLLRLLPLRLLLGLGYWRVKKNVAGVDDVDGQSKCVASTSDSVEASGWLEGLLILI